MHWIVVTEETLYKSIFQLLFDDVLKQDNVSLCDTYFSENGVRKKWVEIFFKRKIDTWTDGILGDLINPQYTIEKCASKTDDNIFLFLNSSCIKVYTKKRIKRLKKRHPTSKFVLLFLDAVFQPQSKNAFDLAQSGIFDLVYSFDKDDSMRYGYHHVNTPYSKKYDSVIGKGAYFCGSEKGRIGLLDEIAKKFYLSDIEYTFDVYGNPDLSTKWIAVKNLGYTEYENIVKKTLGFNCIVDIVQSGRSQDTGLSLRVYEALIYNKVLITNNSNILNFEYYSPKYMHYITKADDINPEWVTDRAFYNYNNQLSPIHLFADILKKLEGKD